MTSDSRQWSARMTATLSAEVEGKIPAGFVADIVRAVLDESRQPAQDPAVESTLFEARRRLARFIRARSFSADDHADGDHGSRVGDPILRSRDTSTRVPSPQLVAAPDQKGQNQ
jgi:hypothetical protein